MYNEIIAFQAGGAARDCFPETVAIVKVARPGLVGGDYFYVQPAALAASGMVPWPESQWWRRFSSAAALVADCGQMTIIKADDPAAQAVFAAWPRRTVFGKAVA
jgi:hypothetical protein